jgi:transcriptional regulator with XRE-family HTH domain
MPDRLTSHLSSKLKQVRAKRGLTQAEVAKLAGTNTNYYAKVERAEATPSIKMLLKIVKALGVTPNDVLPS